MKLLIKVVLLLFMAAAAYGRGIKEYRIHDRGMLHETVYNTGVIGRNWIIRQNVANLPLMEWPPRSETIIDGIEYSGHHNTIGGGVYISANEKGKPGWKDADGNNVRLFSFCGGIGTPSTTEEPLDRWSFPISMEEIENYPLLEDGSLNPDYDPDEAEEIIIAKWSTSTGITVTRTSRAWSYPDYDDLIIYEYELEHTGDTDGDLSTIERDVDLVDILFTVNYGFAPSMLGYQRHYNEWYYNDFLGMYRQDQRSTFDPDYFLTFMQTVHTGARDSDDEFLMAKPEPNKELFHEFASTGKNGGGLLSPQAPGYCWLYWERDHMAIVDPNDAGRNESDYADILRVQKTFFEVDDEGHIKQPWQMKTQSGNTRTDKMEDRAATMDERWWTYYGEMGVAGGLPSDEGRFIIPDPFPGWAGRARFEWDESYNGVGVCNGMGPYVLKRGEKLEFAIAEVVGFGASEGKICCGGQREEQFFTCRSMNRRVVVDGETYTENYLDDYGYPDYVNSDVISVNQVAHQAWEAYLGEEIPIDPSRKGPPLNSDGSMRLWPEQNPKPSENDSKYKIPVPCPAPVIFVSNTSQATVEILWKSTPEQFSHPRLTGALQSYVIWRSEAAMGPWTVIDTVMTGDVNEDGDYLYIDNDESFKLGESKYYSVTSVDVNGNHSGRTNITLHRKNVFSVEKLAEVYAVPNPFYIKSGFTGIGEDKKIGFYGLPAKCEIRIFSYAGQLIETIEHDEQVFSTAWFQVTRNNQDLASGAYFFVVTTPEGDQTTGKFLVIK